MTNQTESARPNPTGRSRAEELRARFSSDHARAAEAAEAAEAAKVVAPEPPRPVRIVRPGAEPEPVEEPVVEPAAEFDFDAPPGSYYPPAAYDGGGSFVASPENEGGGGEDFTGSRVKLDEHGNYVMPAPSGDMALPVNVLLTTGSHYAWIRYENGRPTGERRDYGGGIPMPKREDLMPPPPSKSDDPDALDPWSNNGYLHLADPRSGEEYTFSTSGAWGRGAIGRLSAAIRGKQRTIPAALPLIKLSSWKKEPAKKGWRSFYIPVFTIVGWRLPDGTAPQNERPALR
jgi:hypothetical protein